MSADRERARVDLARDGLVLSEVPILIGDHIENAGNADCLRAAANMVGWSCDFLTDSTGTDALDALVRRGVPIIAIENAPRAENLFTYRPPTGVFAVVVGNERKGVARDILRVADRVVEIPMRSRQLNCLNVASAASIALYRLARRRPSGSRPGGARPAIAFAGVADPIELGSAIRSAACFGWQEVFVADHHDVWFDTDRATRSLGRGAARRGRNPIRVAPLPPSAFDEVCVVGTDDGEPLRPTELARGPGQLIVIGDATEIDARRVRRVRIDVERGRHPFRLVASIALAEIATHVR